MTPPSEGLEITVTAFQWAWGFTYPNGVQTTNNVVVPVNETVIFHVTSSDVKHKFGIPYFKIAADAIPGENNTIWIRSTSTGEYSIRCYELCGIGHAYMTGRLTVVNQTQFSQWLSNVTRSG